MKRKTKSLTVPANYMQAWGALFRRSPEELDADRQSRQPAPAPRTPNGGQKS
jgi:hypothetical protein